MAYVLSVINGGLANYHDRVTYWYTAFIAQYDPG